MSPLTTRSRRLSARAVVLAVLAVLAAACAGDDAGEGGEPAAGLPGDAVVVASFNFPESALVAEIYAGALEAAGVPVRREPGLGPRELVQPALLQGLVDVVPEYLGTALASLAGDPGVDPTDPAAVRRRLAEVAEARGLRLLEPAPAQNQNGLVVTRATATRLGLRAVSDLAPTSGGLALAGPTECPERPYCLVGLERVYGLRFDRFLAFDSERQRATALREGVADVAVMFTTDGDLAVGDLVLLADDRRLQPVENIAPLVSARAVDRHGERLTGTLAAVSTRLTSENLAFLNWRVAVGGQDVESEAAGWLERHGLAGER